MGSENFHRLKLIFFFLCLSQFNAIGQEMIKAEVLVQEPSVQGKPLGYYIHMITYKDLEKGIVTNSRLEMEPSKKKETVDTDFGNLSITSDPSYDLVNYKTGEHWALAEGEHFKIARREKSIDNIDSSAFYNLRYTGIYKKIATFNCEKVIIVNKLTNSEDSMYVAKELNHYHFRILRKYGPIDFIVQTFGHFDNATQAYTIVSVKEELVPADTFKIPKGYIYFYTLKEQTEWENEQYKRANEMRKLLKLPFKDKN